MIIGKRSLVQDKNYWKIFLNRRKLSQMWLYLLAVVFKGRFEYGRNVSEVEKLRSAKDLAVSTILVPRVMTGKKLAALGNRS